MSVQLKIIGLGATAVGGAFLYHQARRNNWWVSVEKFKFFLKNAALGLVKAPLTWFVSLMKKIPVVGDAFAKTLPKGVQALVEGKTVIVPTWEGVPTKVALPTPWIPHPIRPESIAPINDSRGDASGQKETLGGKLKDFFTPKPGSLGANLQNALASVPKPAAVFQNLQTALASVPKPAAVFQNLQTAFQNIPKPVLPMLPIPAPVAAVTKWVQSLPAPQPLKLPPPSPAVAAAVTKLTSLFKRR